MTEEFPYNRDELYGALSSKVKQILRKRLEEDGVEFVRITHRAKSTESFLDKIAKKQQIGSSSEIRDRAGARLVYLYKSDLPQIEKAIEDEFNVLEKRDTVSEQAADRFGYGDVKFYVTLKVQKGPRYGKLKDLLCEIQVRTLAQDAWAIVSHRLVYKNEDRISQLHQRHLNRLAGLFELADDEFNRIRNALKAKSGPSMPELIEEKKFLNQAINLNNLKGFVEKYINVSRNRPILLAEIMYLEKVVEELHESGYSTLIQLHKVLERVQDALKVWRDLTKPPKQDFYLGVDLQVALALTDEQYRNKCGEVVRDFAEKNAHLVK